MKKETTKKETKKKVLKYKASVRVLGKTYKAEGKTIYEAIEKLKPGIVNGSIILKVERGEKGKEAIVPAILAKRLFNMAGISREVQIKNASQLFEGI